MFRSLAGFFRIEPTPGRVFGLDLLRAIAICLVLIEHAGAYVPERWQPLYYDNLVYDGVSIFFVLSGFLIGGILIRLLDREKPTFSAWRQFLIRRWFRTVPNYFLVLTVLVLIGRPLDPHFDPRLIKYYYLFVQNFRTPQPGFFPEAWSLPVEEWFYLLVPASVFLLMNLSKVSQRKAIPVVALLFIAGATAVRYHRFLVLHVDDYYTWDVRLRKQVITRLDTLMFGVLGAYVAHYRPALWLRWRKPLLGLGLGLLVLERYSRYFIPPFSLHHVVGSFSINAIGTLLLLPFLGSYRREKGWFVRTTTTISIISYSMYLLNLSVVFYLILGSFGFPGRYGPAGDALAYVLYWTLTIGLSVLLYKYYERPMTSLRERLSKPMPVDIQPERRR